MQRYEGTALPLFLTSASYVCPGRKVRLGWIRGWDCGLLEEDGYALGTTPPTAAYPNSLLSSFSPGVGSSPLTCLSCCLACKRGERSGWCQDKKAPLPKHGLHYCYTGTLYGCLNGSRVYTCNSTSTGVSFTHPRCQKIHVHALLLHNIFITISWGYQRLRGLIQGTKHILEASQRVSGSLRDRNLLQLIARRRARSSAVGILLLRGRAALLLLIVSVILRLTP